MTALFRNTPLEDVLRLEQAGFNAWPALQTALDGPWILRQAKGVTKRANSINTLSPDQDDPASLTDRLDRAGALFRQNGLLPVFRVSPLTAATTLAELDRRNWTEKDPSLVMHGALPVPDTTPEPDLLTDQPTADWLETFGRVDGLSPQACCTLKAILRGILLPRAYACLCHDGQPASVALAVVDGPLMGVFCVGTVPEARRQGLSQRTLAALLHWGSAQGARRLWLQVSAANTAAQTLYARMGLAPAYGYSYRVCPDASSR